MNRGDQLKSSKPASPLVSLLIAAATGIFTGWFVAVVQVLLNATGDPMGSLIALGVALVFALPVGALAGIGAFGAGVGLAALSRRVFKVGIAPQATLAAIGVFIVGAGACVVLVAATMFVALVPIMWIPLLVSFAGALSMRAWIIQRQPGATG
ncbi:hypothetical protein [Agromyces sp. Root81]|uniref:hypothetical protein n=1 Tax=Agromyces sp. Root81 TaxID=1736601 RepID=UPI0012FBD4EA|nr:hypothetical protein [Agromyces sp. Root81]